MSRGEDRCGTCGGAGGEHDGGTHDVMAVYRAERDELLAAQQAERDESKGVGE